MFIAQAIFLLEHGQTDTLTNKLQVCLVTLDPCHGYTASLGNDDSVITQSVWLLSFIYTFQNYLET